MNYILQQEIVIESETFLFKKICKYIFKYNFNNNEEKRDKLLKNIDINNIIIKDLINEYKQLYFIHSSYCLTNRNNIKRYYLNLPIVNNKTLNDIILKYFLINYIDFKLSCIILFYIR